MSIIRPSHPSLPVRHAARAPLAAALGLTALVMAGCGESSEPDVLQVTGDVSAASDAPSATSTLSFEAFDDDVGTQAATESRTLIRTARGYQAFFGHAPPAGVDFSREWVMFYAAGSKPTGGYEASFLALLRSGNALIAITRLVAPGAACGTTQAFTTPHALIKFAAQARASAQFFKQDAVQDCVPNRCAAVTCPTGTSCDPATGLCSPGNKCAAVTCPTGTPCDPATGLCGPTPVRCGGIAGLACPGMGKCADDPSDGCDPNKGGADCGGICSCVQTVACAKSAHFDNSPSVCQCVSTPPVVCPAVCDIYCENGNVLDANGCPTCRCNPPSTTDKCATVRCAAGYHCETKAGSCVPDVTDVAVACGGFAGKACPGSGQCIDDPSDSCDPKNGGADCGGICTCAGPVPCPSATTFDSSPSVCACVPKT